MKTRYVSIKNAVLEFTEDSGLNYDDLDEKMILRWANDVVRNLTFDQQLLHRIVVLQVEHSKARLPDDFRILTQAAARVFYYPPCDCEKNPSLECCSPTGDYVKPGYAPTRRHQVIQWTQQAFEEDCEIEIKLNCPNCKGDNCSCGGAVEVDVDRIWELSHPEYYYQHFNRVRRVGEGGNATSFYSPKFNLMRYATNNLFRVEQILGECANLYCPSCPNSFNIQGDYLEVDFNDGEVLLSYLGTPMDDYGHVMIPDHPYVHEAVSQHLTFKYFSRKFNMESRPEDERKALSAEQRSIVAKRRAHALLNTPDFQEFNAWMEENWFKRLRKTKIRPGEQGRDEYKAYKKWLDEGTQPIERPIQKRLYDNRTEY